MVGAPDTGIMRGDLVRAAGEWSGDPVTGAYLHWWSHGKYGAALPDRWDGLLRDVTVELRGPAETVPVETTLLARVLRGPEPDPSCDIAYCNHQYWPDVDKSAARLAFVSKGDEASAMPHGRRIWASNSLFHGGDWNILPAAMLDLLTGGARVTVTGATFYAAGRDYADDSSVNPWESIRQHNPVVNRRIVKNLWDARVVSAAGAAADVLALSDGEYVAALSAHRAVD
jgi:hypothetical protein